MGWHDTAQVCPNGHVANREMRQSPEFNKTFCEKCGERTFSTCPSCISPIRGEYHVEGVVAIGFPFTPPAFCPSCGKSFPWTERKQQAAIELFIEETQDQEERREFAESVEQITKDTPQAPGCVTQDMRLLGKLGKGTAQAIKDILVDVASEVAKKGLVP